MSIMKKRKKPVKTVAPTRMLRRLSMNRRGTPSPSPPSPKKECGSRFMNVSPRMAPVEKAIMVFNEESSMLAGMTARRRFGKDEM